MTPFLSFLQFPYFVLRSPLCLSDQYSNTLPYSPSYTPQPLPAWQMFRTQNSIIHCFMYLCIAPLCIGAADNYYFHVRTLRELSFPMRSPTQCCLRAKFLRSTCFRKYILHFRHCHIFGTGRNMSSPSFLVHSCGITLWRQPMLDHVFLLPHRDNVEMHNPWFVR